MGRGCNAAAAIERANAKLAEFQRISRWVLWPEPDLPRTSTGKVRRKPVAAWLARIQAAAATTSNGAPGTAAGNFGPSSDWLLALIAQITGEAHPGVGDELRLTEDLHLDSLGRVQLSAAIEERLGIVEGSGLLEEVQTLGELRRLVGEEAGNKGTRGQGNEDAGSKGAREQGSEKAGTEKAGTEGTREQGNEKTREQESGDCSRAARPLCLSRVAVVEAVPMAARGFS